MGYYTDFKLSVEGNGPVYDKFMQEIEGIRVARGNYDLEMPKLLNGYYQEMKWYEHEEDMKTLSLEWPNLLFILEGDGENRGDVWKAWFRNGLMHKMEAKIVFETLQPDLDTLLPLNKEFEEKMKADMAKEKKAKIAMLRRELEELLNEE